MERDEIPLAARHWVIEQLRAERAWLHDRLKELPAGSTLCLHRRAYPQNLAWDAGTETTAWLTQTHTLSAHAMPPGALCAVVDEGGRSQYGPEPAP
jgi:hypothetical protein